VEADTECEDTENISPDERHPGISNTREAVVQERIDLEHLQMNPERLTARVPNAREER